MTTDEMETTLTDLCVRAGISGPEVGSVHRHSQIAGKVIVTCTFPIVRPDRDVLTGIGGGDTELNAICECAAWMFAQQRWSPTTGTSIPLTIAEDVSPAFEALAGLRRMSEDELSALTRHGRAFTELAVRAMAAG